MNKVIKYVEIVLLVIMLIIVSFSVFSKKTTEVTEDIDVLDLERVNNLMIVAHPDDETIFGGEHLLKDNYLVVCVTCVDEERIKEFEKVMAKSGNEYIILGYPDKTNGEKDDWVTSYEGIKSDLSEIIDYKDWKTIVTHNPDGEYGHIHHKMLSKIVTSIANKNKIYYFNHYYTDEELDKMNVEESEYFSGKLELFKIYKSQSAIVENHYKNSRNEMFISYYSWE